MSNDLKKVMVGNPLLECCAPLFSLVLPLRKNSVAEKVSPDLRNKVVECFSEMERMAYEKAIVSADIQSARYAMTAFVDELVMRSSCPQRREWMSKPLQLEFYGKNSAGEVFYEKLDNLRTSGEKNHNLLEVYYLCLQMGYEGHYRLQGMEKLMALQVDIRSQLEDYIGKEDRRLSKDGVPKEGLVMKVGKHFPGWAICSLTGAIMMFMYFGYSWVIHNEAKDSVAYIEKQAAILKVLLAEEQVGK